MRYTLLGALAAQLAHAVIHEIELVQMENAIPPGNAQIDLERYFGSTAYRLVGNIVVGYEGDNTQVLFDSVTSDVVLGNFTASVYDPVNSSSFVRSQDSRRCLYGEGNNQQQQQQQQQQQHHHHHHHHHRRRDGKCPGKCYTECNGACFVDISSPVFNTSTLAFGLSAYEYFNLSGLTIQGQPFCFAEVNGEYPPVDPSHYSYMGFGLGGEKCCSRSNFIDNLYTQAQINNKVISFALNMYGENNNFGYAYVGDIKQEAIGGPITNYTILPEECTWSFPLHNMVVNGTTLGVNGKITIDTNYPFSVVPETTFHSILASLHLNNTNIVQYGALTVAIFNCEDLGTSIEDAPTITYYLGDEPYNLSGRQYIWRGPDACVLSIAGSQGICPFNAAYTLGTFALNGTYALFDSENRVFGSAPLNYPFFDEETKMKI